MLQSLIPRPPKREIWSGDKIRCSTWLLQLHENIYFQNVIIIQTLPLLMRPPRTVQVQLVPVSFPWSSQYVLGVVPRAAVYRRPSPPVPLQHASSPRFPSPFGESLPGSVSASRVQYAHWCASGWYDFCGLVNYTLSWTWLTVMMTNQNYILTILWLRHSLLDDKSARMPL